MVIVSRSARFFLAASCTALLASVVACTAPADEATDGSVNALVSGSRDWSGHPAIVQIDTASEVYAISDIHGGYAELGTLLTQNGLISGFNQDPAKAASIKWTGKTAIFVVAGDLIDKGVESLGVIDLLRALEPQAARAGGRLVVTMGNHEAEFLDDPKNDKATASDNDGIGITVELKKKGIDPKAFAAGTDPEGRGAWLRSLPMAVRIKKWFFSHGGNTGGDSIDKLEKRFESALDGKNGFGDKDITGGDSILEAQSWWGKKAKDYADKLGVKHMVFGHDPGALDDRGRILAAEDGALIKIDVNMGLRHESKPLVGGALLHIKILADAPDTAESLDSSGSETPVL